MTCKISLPSAGGTAEDNLDEYVTSFVDLKSVPGVERHLKRVLGVAKSEKRLIDYPLLKVVRECVDEYWRLARSNNPLDALRLSLLGLSVEEVARLAHVIERPDLWERSSVDVSALYKALATYCQPSEHISPNEDAYASALNDLAACFGGERFTGLIPYPLVDGGIPFQRHKSSGFPMMRDKESDEARALVKAHKLLRSGVVPSPCVAAVRTQQKETGAKTRLVFAYPMEMTLLEGMFAPALTRRIQDHIPVVSYGEGLEDVARMTHHARHCDVIIETDFSQFDATISARLIKDCFAILKGHFILDEDADLAWDRVVKYFVDTPILMPNGKVYTTRKGVPSGSWFTNIIDSMVNFLSVRYSVYRLGIKTPVQINVLGDDALLGFEESVDLGLWSQSCAELGLIMSPEKSKIASSFGRIGNESGRQLPYYLGHYWLPSGAWFRPVHITIARLLYHERYVNLDTRVLRLSKIASHAMDNPSAIQVLYHLVSGTPAVDVDHGDVYRINFVSSIQLQISSLGLPGLSSQPVTGRSELLLSLGVSPGTFNSPTFNRNVWHGYTAA